MPNIKSVRIFTSETNVFNGENVGPGLAVIIDPMPENKDDIIQIGDDIRAVVLASKQKAGDITLNVELNHLIELHEILCGIPFEAATLHDSEPPYERHPAIESMIIQLEQRMVFFERRE
jgi:hypothetical protein